jgi:cytochrome c biogenesis protein
MPQIPNRKRLWHTSPWKWLFSLQTGIALLVLVVLASICGTFIKLPEKAQALVYHTWWYQLLLLALAVNMVCTTLRTVIEKTIPSFRIRFRDPHESRAPGRPSQTIPFSGNAEAVAQAFRKRRFGVVTQGPLGYAWKGRITRLGSPISHLGIVIILLGGFLMSWVSREGVVELAEGEETSEMWLRSAPDQPVSLGFTLRCDDFETGFFPKTRIPSKYISSLTILGSQNAIRTGVVEVNRSMVVNGWKIHQAEFTEIPGASRFLLEVGKKDLPASVTLELSPGQTRLLPGMAHAGISLGDKFPYPWTLTAQDGGKSRGTLFPENTVLRFDLTMKDPKGDSPLRTIRLGLNEETTIAPDQPDGSGNAKGLRVRVDSFVADFVMGADRKVTSRSDELNNPAAHITVMEGNKEVLSQWLFAREDLKGMAHRGDGAAYEFDLAKVSRVASKKEDLPPEQPGGGAEWRVSVVNTVPAYRTILTLTRNPALPIIYGGCGIVMAGLLLVFLMGRKEIRFRADERKKLLHVVGIYRHPTEEFDGTTAGILERLRRPEEPAAQAAEPLAVIERGGLKAGGEG